ncbi:unnamed protein product [Lasius platythorax]|uniref:G-protein coupled receptors family 2 profile 2 domain-containing protein n=1 Tax=Lasius platythorax TaxID=488582 RepID=A0AAV2N123_9HYME
MFTIKFVLLGVLMLSSTKVSSESHLAKCCPSGKIFSGNSTVECVSVPSSMMELYVLHRNVTKEFQGLPQCDEPEDIMTTSLDDFDSKFLEVPACLEILYDQITRESTVIIVHCQSNKDRQVNTINAFFPQLAYVRKCCSHNTIYDSRAKVCVPWLNKSESLVTFLSNRSTDVDFVIANESSPTCKGPIVDYEIDEDDVFLRNGTYSVMIPVFKNNVIIKEEFFLTKDNACLEMLPNSMFNRRLAARVCRDSKFCDRNSCIRKCCTEDEFFFYAQGCNKLTMPEEPIEFYQAFANAVNQTESTFNMSKDYGVLIGKPCEHGMYSLDPREEEWLLTSKGHVLAEDYQLFDQNKYCMDIFYNKSEFDHSFHLFICFDDSEPPQYFTTRCVNTVLQIISCAFLLMTLLVYVCLPSLQNLHGKTLMCHVSSLFLAFTCLTITTWIIPDSEVETLRAITSCKALAYTMLFCFLSSFSWLNVMCFDIWWTFGVLRGSTITKARGHRKKFLLYCLYAWGLSLLVSILAIIADYTDILPDYLQPDIGNTSCWFTQNPDSFSELTFFIGPITIQLISNVVFFVLTSVHCNKVKAELKRVTTDPMDPRSKRFHSDRSRFAMNIKLFIVMGISWSCESRVYLALRRRLGLNVKKKRSPTCNATTTLQDPYKIRKSASSSTLMTTFAISSTP